MKDILQIDFNLDNAKYDFVKSLSETGFAVIKNHNIDKNLISNVYNDWKVFFSSEDNIVRVGGLVGELGAYGNYYVCPS